MNFWCQAQRNRNPGRTCKNAKPLVKRVLGHEYLHLLRYPEHVATPGKNNSQLHVIVFESVGGGRRQQ